ncbi:hypothetical protein IXB50_21815 [Leptothoe spongobia TAU-MAC 1115]|uniref:Uncharacterized protein n=1 Tax=Leptothoe spongobia TAU-MAC 1115 TaxID=1967444 RepID=A0A947GL75_9CYAN|nr:hypothetical protein [Leptothoe spongobia TAU-MAC 1115]
MRKREHGGASSKQKAPRQENNAALRLLSICFLKKGIPARGCCLLGRSGPRNFAGGRVCGARRLAQRRIHDIYKTEHFCCLRRLVRSLVARERCQGSNNTRVAEVESRFPLVLVLACAAFAEDCVQHCLFLRKVTAVSPAFEFITVHAI